MLHAPSACTLCLKQIHKKCNSKKDFSNNQNRCLYEFNSAEDGQLGGKWSTQQKYHRQNEIGCGVQNKIGCGVQNKIGCSMRYAI